MATESKLMTAQELLELQSEVQSEGRSYELLDGVLVEMAPMGGAHGQIMSRVSHILNTHIDAGGSGVVLAGDVGIFLRHDPDRVRAPDVCYFAQDRLPANRAPAGYLDVMPDLIVEVISPSDRAAEVQEKIQEWLSAGARLVWAMYPQTHSIAAYEPLGTARVYTESDTIDAEPVLPGFSARVADFFS